MILPLLSVHVSCRIRVDQGSILSKSECDMKQPVQRSLSQGIETLLSVTMPCILDNDQWIVEEDAFRLRLTDAVFVRALAAVAIVPVKASDLVKVDHCVYDRNIKKDMPMQYGGLRFKEALSAL